MTSERTGRPALFGRAFVRAGFSIIELVVCLTILAVAAAIAVPRYAASQQRYRVLTAGERVAGDVARACELARAASQTVTVTFTINNPVYSAATGTGKAGGFACDLSAPPYECWVQGADFGGSPLLQVTGYGVPVAAGTVTVRAEGLASVVTVGADGVASVSEPAKVPRAARPKAVEWSGVPAAMEGE
jgi:prepilin-type N-terminal cleavage/methylation domain-containing protein